MEAIEFLQIAVKLYDAGDWFNSDDILYWLQRPEMGNVDDDDYYDTETTTLGYAVVHAYGVTDKCWDVAGFIGHWLDVCDIDSVLDNAGTRKTIIDHYDAVAAPEMNRGSELWMLLWFKSQWNTNEFGEDGSEMTFGGIVEPGSLERMAVANQKE